MTKTFFKWYQRYKQVIAYLFWGGLTTLVDLVCFGLLFKFNYEIRYALAWFISTLFAYVTNRKWVFHSTKTGFKAYLKEMTEFFAGRIGSLIIGDLILWFGISQLKFNTNLEQNIVNLISQIFIVVINYFWSKLAVFKP